MFEELSESVAEREKFRIAANKLLNQCFVLKKKEDTRKEYIYIRENRELFKQYFDLLGYQVRINEDQGVIALAGDYETGRLQLTKIESIELLILRLLYIERRKEISSSYEDVVVLMEEIREKYSLLKIKAKPVMDKGMEKRMISLFRKYNIIKNLDSDVNQADTRILIYPSILMAVTVEDINELYELTDKKLKEYASLRDGEESDESAE
ncbi:MAG: DUF4194 domain-containing protein [Lachnospiraceae bacterium]|nr:DUF4194 domain-containing protein [Lachnospiraceae bacterium]